MNTYNESNTMNVEPTKGKLIKVGRWSVRKAKGFIWDRCHAIYLVAKASYMREVLADGWKIYPMEKLESTFKNSCPLRFISWYEGPQSIVRQFAREITFTYTNRGSVISCYHRLA